MSNAIRGSIRPAQGQFGCWLRKQRIRLDMSRKDLAKYAKIDPTLVFYLEQGNPTSRHKVERIARALGSNVDEAMLMAGYAPVETPVCTLIEASDGAILSGLTRSLREALHGAIDLSPKNQRSAALFLRSVLAGLKNG